VDPEQLFGGERFAYLHCAHKQSLAYTRISTRISGECPGTAAQITNNGGAEAFELPPMESLFKTGQRGVLKFVSQGAKPKFSNTHGSM
jgi:hypothetical protein